MPFDHLRNAADVDQVGADTDDHARLRPRSMAAWPW
jgi:hypothetical protein